MLHRSTTRSRGFCTASLLATAFLVLVAPAALAQVPIPAFSKSFAPATVGPSSVSTLTFTIMNANATPVSNMAFVDNLPAGMTIASPANLSVTCLGTVGAPDGGTTITLSDGGVGGSSSCTLSVDVTASAPGTYTNVSGDLTSDAGNSGNAAADLVVDAGLPGFTKSFSPSAVAFGGRSTLSLTIDNTANAGNRINLSFTDNLPVGMEIASPSNASTTCTGGKLSAPAGRSVISYEPRFPGDASVAAGSSCSVNVDVLGNAVGVLDNTTGELTSAPQGGGPAVSSGEASATLTVSFEQILIIKSFSDDPAPPGGTVTLRFTIANRDRTFDATNISFTDNLEAVFPGLVAVGLPQHDVCGAGASLTGTGAIALTGGTVASGTECSFDVTLQIPADAAGSATNVTSDLNADIGGQAVTGTPATDLLFVEPAPMLTKTFLDDPVGAGDSVVLEFRITNTSPDSDAVDIAFEDIFDVVLPTASAVPADGFCGAGSTATYTLLTNPTGSDATPARLTIAGADLGPGESCTFSITPDVAVGAATGVYPNTTSAITAVVEGAGVSGKPAGDDLEVVAAPRLNKEFIGDPVVAGNTITLHFTLSHDENAPAGATAISFSDDLDATLPGLVATGLPAADVCGAGSALTGTMTLMLANGSLAPGETCTFDVTLQVPAGAAPGSYANTTSAVVADVLGVPAMANPATDDLRVAGLVLSKEFTDDPTLPGGTVDLSFTIANTSPASTATDISFLDDLDDVINNLAAISPLPLNDICGAGSSLSGAAGNQLLVFQDGTLGPGESCTFDVTLAVPAATAQDVYPNATSDVLATIDGTPNVQFDNASDELTIASDFLSLTKEFLDDPVGPGQTVTLRFTITNLNTTEAVAAIAFTDDLDAALTGLVSGSGTLADVCGVGSQITGTDVISFTGGSLAAGAACSFDLTLQVPQAVTLGEVATNVSSPVTGTIGGLPATGGPATDDLRIDFLDFNKVFGATVFPGDIVTLTFTIEELTLNQEIIGLSFSDDLDAALSGLENLSGTLTDVCGVGSTVGGTSFLTLTEGSLLPGGSCSFSVDLQVPATAVPGAYLNVTGELQQFGVGVAQPAIDTLTVREVVNIDEDNDGVLDDQDVCPGTVIPEGVPTRVLRPNRYALVDGDLVFERGGNRASARNPSQTVFTTTDTAGCSCEQIIEAQGLGNGHTKFGCSLGAMRNWVDMVGP